MFLSWIVVEAYSLGNLLHTVSGCRFLPAWFFFNDLTFLLAESNYACKPDLERDAEGSYLLQVDTCFYLWHLLGCLSVSFEGWNKGQNSTLKYDYYTKLLNL